MDDYISREAAIKEFFDDCMDREWCKSNGESCSRINNINTVPATNVRPVVKGKWIDGKCDQCGAHAPYWCMASTYHTTNFCPNCGAEMREVKADDR